MRDPRRLKKIFLAEHRIEQNRSCIKIDGIFEVYFCRPCFWTTIKNRSLNVMPRFFIVVYLSFVNLKLVK